MEKQSHLLAKVLEAMLVVFFLNKSCVIRLPSPRSKQKEIQKQLSKTDGVYCRLKNCTITGYTRRFL